MDFAGLNYIAIAVAAAASFIFGGVWYGLLAKPWMQATGLDEARIKAASRGANGTWSYILAFVCQLIMACVLAGLMGHLGENQVTIRNGLISAVFVWLGFIATTITVNHTFQQRLGMLTLIDTGHWLGVLLIQGLIIGLMGV